jgi:hypothetical protein
MTLVCEWELEVDSNVTERYIATFVNIAFC